MVDPNDSVRFLPADVRIVECDGSVAAGPLHGDAGRRAPGTGLDVGQLPADVAAELDRARFGAVLAPFLLPPGLPFAATLSSEDIRRAFADRGGLFAMDGVYSTPVVLWAFLAQVLQDGKMAACSAAVANIAAYRQRTGGPVPAGDTGDYCRARAKLHPQALRELTRRVAQGMERELPQPWLWHGRSVKLVDGFTFTMPDTPANQRAYPQQSGQAPGVGFPIARACVVLSLTTAAVVDLALGPYAGKQTGEPALLRSLLEGFGPGELVVFDRYYCSFMMLALLARRGVDVCARLHQARDIDWNTAVRIGPNQYRVLWRRPVRPEWMSPRLYAEIPETLALRLVEYTVKQPARPDEPLQVVTTLTEPQDDTGKDIARLYGYRWSAELDIRDIKRTLGLDHTRCKSPEMVLIEMWTTLLGYNLVRRTIAGAARLHDLRPRQIGFTNACQVVLTDYLAAAVGRAAPRAWTETALCLIARRRVGDRPGRIEPRVNKRRLIRYPLMNRPRDQLRQALINGTSTG